MQFGIPLFLGLGLALIPVNAAVVTVIRDVNVIDGTGAGPVPHSTIVIKDERIVTLGPVAKVATPPGARVIEGAGRYVIPGLWDMHVHLWHSQNQLPVYVANGVTGVRDMGSDFVRTNAWREAVEAGKAIGPHVVTSGPAVAGKKPDDDKLPVIVAVDAEAARRAFDQLDDMGVDFVKVLTDLPRQSYFALAERARKWRGTVAGHIPAAVTAREAINARQASVEHLFGLFVACSSMEERVRAGQADAAMAVKTFDEEKARELFKQSALFETRQTPTLTLWERMSRTEAAARVHDPRLRYVPQAIRATWPKAEEELKPLPDDEAAAMRAQVDVAYRMVRLMKETGVEIMAGTDTGDPYTVPGVTLQRELELLVKAGLTPAQALETATVIPARFLGWEESMGTLKAGMVADLVVLDANPLADIRNVSKVSGVAVRGRYLQRSQIRAILDGVK
ncbi:MAG: amidohydrolase family protein [Acidobacteria bacterium]|nr:amidohydrolase family protein [Acidobacteriota bacterium]